ncbi:MAG: GAF domain-containing protein, partial [Anaerolineae bacterium]|nr:GAF domain-containing protein [Anaerolineae bacterium]
LLLIPYTVFQRNANVQDQHSAYLDTLGPYALSQVELTFTELTGELERLIYTPADYQQLEEFLYLAPYATSNAARQELEQFIAYKTARILDQTSSITRIRFLDPDGNTLVDVTSYDDVYDLRYEVPAQEITPADTLIANGQWGSRSTITDIYLDLHGAPSLDVVFPLRPPWDQLGTAPILGLVIFTQDLTRASADNTLPDLLAALRDIPQHEHPVQIFVLNEDGALLPPDDTFEVFADAHNAEGYRLAQRGATAASTYDSPILGEEVIAHHTVLNIRYRPQLTLLLETPLDELQREVLRDSALIVFGYVMGFVALSMLALYIGRSSIIQPIVQLTQSAREISTGNLTQNIRRQDRGDEIGALNNAFNDMARQLVSIIGELEIKLSEQTHTLDITQAIAHILAGGHDLDTQLEEAVTLIRQRFGQVYHAQVFIIDPTTRRAVLHASTGLVGRTLIRQGHALEIGSPSVIGNVTATGHAVVVLDTSESPIHRPNDELPDTRAEMALPLRMSGHIIGALDLQSTMPHTFSEQDIEVFQGIADQISSAVNRAALSAESQQKQREIECLNRALTQAVWEEGLAQLGPVALSAASGDIAPDYSAWTSLQLEAMQTHAIAERIEGNTVIFAVPVMLRDQALGAIEWQVPRAQYSAETHQTAQELATRLALSVENLRLFEQSRRATQRELLVNQISSKLIGTTDIDQILQTAVRELGLALHVPHTAIRLAPPTSRTPDPPTEPQDG